MSKTSTVGASKGAPTRVIDLDAARAARAEAAGDPVTLRISGEDFELPAEMPVDFALLAAEGKMREAIQALLGDHADAFFAMRPSLQDLAALAEQAGEVYGVSPGEALASPSS